MDIPIFIPLLLLGLLSIASCETCPPAEDISPCECKPSPFVAGKINIFCTGVRLADIDKAFDHLREKDLDVVDIWKAKGDRLPSLLFWNTRARVLVIMNCDLQGLSDSDTMPPFLGLENSLKNLLVTSSIQGDNQLKTLDLSHLKNLKDLTLSVNNIPEVGNDWFAKGPFSLTEVTFRDCGLSKLGDAAFAPLANLQTLRLWNNNLTGIDRSMIPNPASHLQVLDLDDNRITRLPNDIFSGMPSLKSVWLKKNSIRRIEEATWSSAWEELDRVELEDNPLECDSHMEWLFSQRQPRVFLGTCQSPDSVKGVKLSKFIEDNRKLLSLI